MTKFETTGAVEGPGGPEVGTTEFYDTSIILSLAVNTDLFELRSELV